MHSDFISLLCLEAQWKGTVINMKVTDIKPFVVDCFRTNWVFIKVYTDEGIDGVGEATLEYKEKALLGADEGPETP